jgi:2,5-diketo-D-gluconate reductase A
LIVTTKLWTDAHAEDLAVHAARDSLERLGLDYVDLFLIHWPDSRQGRYLAAWEGLQRAQQLGLAREIGVSNFSAAQLDELIAGGTTPAINQVELHPYNSRHADQAAHDRRGIVTESWSPLARGRVFDDEVLNRIATEVGATVAQVVLSWHCSRGLIAIAKASSSARLAENLAAGDLTLSPAQLAAIDSLNRSEVIEPDYYLLS